MYRILIAEDNKAISNLIKTHLSFAGYDTSQVYDGEFALEILEAEPFDLLILDLMLPKVSGVDILARVKDCQMPIIVVTALDDLSSKVQCLQVGADDYITKPFSMPILVRKIGAVLRRSSMIPEQEHQTITYKNLVLDMDSYTAVVDGVSFDLTQREFEVLRELLLNQGRVLTRQNLLDKLWRYDFYGDESVVDTHIKNLRKKLGIDFIQTIRGVGYKIDKEN